MRERISSKGIHHTAIFSSQRRSKRAFNKRGIKFGLTLLVGAAALAACSPSTPTLAPTLPALPTLTAASTSAAAPAAPATGLDPCQLIPSQEASALAGASFGTGEEKTEIGGLKMCTYSAQSGNVFTVEAVEAPDLATAQGQEAQFMASLQAQLPQLSTNGMNVTQLPDLANGGIMGEASSSTSLGNISGSAIGFVKGTIFFGFSDIVQGGPAPTSAALQSEATTVIARLP